MPPEPDGPRAAPSRPATLDRPGPVRAGEELDRTRLARYLTDHLAELRAAGAEAVDGEDLEVQQFGSGYSNLTYLIRLPGAAADGGDGEWVLRRPPFGSSVATAHDMAREHRILSRLRGTYPKAPRPVLFCDDPAVLGAPFYLMERLHGIILRGGRRPEVELDTDGRRRLTEAFVDAFAELHGIDVEAAGLADLGRPEGYVERQVRGWTERYLAARTDDVPEVERAAAWLGARLEAGMPGTDTARRPALIHNDFKLDNLVLAPEEPTRILGVLDWEMATVGDPLMDLGSSLAYWISASDPPELRQAPVPRLTAEPGGLSRTEVVERYERETGRTIDDPVFYFVYGQLKLAGILQQIYARFRKGATRDPRFAGLLPLIRACGRAAELAVSRDRIDFGPSS